MTSVKAGTEDLPMEKMAVKQLSREYSLIGNGREKPQGKIRHISTHVLIVPRGQPHDTVTRRPSDQYWAGYQLEQYGVLAPRCAHWSSKCSHAEVVRDIALAMRPNDAGYHATGLMAAENSRVSLADMQKMFRGT
jgi:hypothetical protein